MRAVAEIGEDPLRPADRDVREVQRVEDRQIHRRLHLLLKPPRDERAAPVVGVQHINGMFGHVIAQDRSAFHQ